MRHASQAARFELWHSAKRLDHLIKARLSPIVRFTAAARLAHLLCVRVVVHAAKPAVLGTAAAVLDGEREGLILLDRAARELRRE